MTQNTQLLVINSVIDTSPPNFYLGLPSGFACDQEAEYKNISFEHAVEFFRKTTSEVVDRHKKALNGMITHADKFLSLFPSSEAQCTLYKETHFMSFWPQYLRIAFPLNSRKRIGKNLLPGAKQDSDQSIIILHYKYFDGNNGSYQDEARFSLYLEISDMPTIKLADSDKVVLRDNFFTDIGTEKQLLLKPLVFSYYATADLNEFDYPERKLSWSTCRPIEEVKEKIKNLTSIMGCEYFDIHQSDPSDPPMGCYLTVQKY